MFPSWRALQYKQTPLHVAAYAGALRCVDLLLKSGADPDATRDVRALSALSAFACLNVVVVFALSGRGTAFPSSAPH